MPISRNLWYGSHEREAKKNKHTFSQGFLEGVQGGNAFHGMMMGAVSGIGGHYIDKYHNTLGKGGEIAASAILGGTVDELGGGKFANGAITSAFTVIFNDMMHPLSGEENIVLPNATENETYRLYQKDKPLELVFPEFGLLTIGVGVINFVSKQVIKGVTLGRKGILEWLNNVGSMNPSQLRNDLIKAGFRRESNYSEHYSRGSIKIRLDGPHKHTPYNHMHIDYGKKTIQSYDIHLNKVDRRSPDAHIPIR